MHVRTFSAICWQGEHPLRPLPTWKEAITRSTVKAIGRVILITSVGGPITIKVGMEMRLMQNLV